MGMCAASTSSHTNQVTTAENHSKFFSVKTVNWNANSFFPGVNFFILEK